MNIGDGLLFELENGKPKLVLLNKGTAKDSAKSKPANVLSLRQSTCGGNTQGDERPGRQLAGQPKEVRWRTERPPPATAPLCKPAACAEPRRSKAFTQRHGQQKKEQNKGVAKSNKQNPYTPGLGGVNRQADETSKSWTFGCAKTDVKDQQQDGDSGRLDNFICLTNEQLQKILSTVQATRNNKDDKEPVEKSSAEGEACSEVYKAETNSESKENTRSSSRSMFGWLEEQQLQSKAASDAKKAQWRRELDEQVAQKKNHLVPVNPQVGEYGDRESVASGEQHAAIRSSLKLGGVTPMEEEPDLDRKEEQRRRWLEELDRQREETTERRKREKLLRSEVEDHEHWAAHFDSLQRKTPPRAAAVPSAPPTAQLAGSERREWDPSSSLSLAWDASSSCRADSVIGGSVDLTSRCQTRASYVRTMTSLLDPAQIEERERRRLKQLEQQRAIEVQMEERKKLKEQEEMKRKLEEEKEERRLALEREMLQKQYDLETKKEKSEPEGEPEPEPCQGDKSPQDRPESSEKEQEKSVKERNISPLKDSAVQTDTLPPPLSDRVPTLDVAVQHQQLSTPSPAPPGSRSQASRPGKENICQPVDEDAYEPFARSTRSRGDKKRPEWNTQRPTRRFVPASQRYPAHLQRNRQESRLKRQAELLALQERACMPKPAEPAPQSQNQELRRVDTLSGERTSCSLADPERELSPPVSVARHNLQDPELSGSPPLLEFVPYVRTNEVNLNPLEPADNLPHHTHSAPPHLQPLLNSTRTPRQQQILRGLAQLRQGLLQKQKELEMDLNPHLNRHEHMLQQSWTTPRT